MTTLLEIGQPGWLAIGFAAIIIIGILGCTILRGKGVKKRDDD